MYGGRGGRDGLAAHAVGITNPNALSAESAALAGPEGGNLAPAPQIPAQPLAPRPASSRRLGSPPRRVPRAAPAQPRPAAPVVCQSCGVVESVRQVQAPVRDNSDHLIGTIAGGVAGGVVGNQFGGGNGKTALTVLGAVAALAGREVERNIRQQQTVTHYELTVRMSDGSAVNSQRPAVRVCVRRPRPRGKQSTAARLSLAAGGNHLFRGNQV